LTPPLKTGRGPRTHRRRGTADPAGQGKRLARLHRPSHILAVGVRLPILRWTAARRANRLRSTAMSFRPPRRLNTTISVGHPALAGLMHGLEVNMT